MTYPVRRLLRCLNATLLASCWLVSTAAMFGQESSSPKPPPSNLPNSAAELPKFEVATIKPAAGDDRRIIRFTPDGISMQGIPMQMLLREAFGVEDDRIVGAPGWAKSNRYDIEAKVDAADAPKLDGLKMDQRRLMLLPLLVERFNLKYHHETWQMPMYSLVIAKSGLKMKESKPDDPAAKDRHGQHGLFMTGRGHLESTGTGIPFLIHVLSGQVGRTIVDKTGLTGSYDYSLQWTPDDAPPPMAGPDGGPPHGDGDDDASGASLFTAVQEQLGLKLESEKAPVDVIVIDHIDLPSEN